MNRRRFMTAMGLAGGSLFLPSVAKRAFAADGSAPQRLFIMFTQHGTYYDGWKMRWHDTPENSTWVRDLRNVSASEFSQGLVPLHPWRKKLSIVDGLALISGEADPVMALQHRIGQAHSLTGALSQSVAGQVLAGGPSLDQRVADQIALKDRLRSLELAVGGGPGISYRAPQQQLPFEHRPQVAWDRVFGFANGQTAGLAQGRASVLDLVSKRHAALAKRLSAADRQKLERHRDMVREVEQRVTGLSNATCTAPERMGERSYGQDFDTMASMVSTAFACDLTRVATINLSDIPGEDLGYPEAGIHDEHAHNIFGNDLSKKVMTEWSAYHASQFASMLQKLDSVPEGNGTMLDNTTCLWVSEMGNGVHEFDSWTAVVAGGRNLKLGRYIHYPADVPMAGWRWDGTKFPSMRRPHSQLLTTIARSFGCTAPSGNLISAMPMRDCYGIGGAKIDLTGSLPELGTV